MADSTNTPPINVGRLAQTFGDDPAVIEELYSTYLEQVRDLLDELREALAQEDGERVNKLAHAIKGSSGNVGADNMRVHASAVEDQSIDCDLETARLHATVMFMEFRAVEGFLENFLKTNC